VTARATALALVLALLLPATARAQGALWLRDAYSGAELRLRPFAGLFRLDRRAAARLNHFVHRDAPSPRAIHPRTVRLLAHLQRHFGGARVDFYSGVRGDGDPTGGHGYHTLARAIDFRVPGVPSRLLFDYCRAARDAGCGLYPNRRFVHLDARPHSAVWVDLTTGKGSRYVKSVDAWLRAFPKAGL
jgi:uncharacterized protein YcbK (DUF882 family)